MQLPELRQHGLHFGGELFLPFDIRVVAFFERVGLPVQPLFRRANLVRFERASGIHEGEAVGCDAFFDLRVEFVTRFVQFLLVPFPSGASPRIMIEKHLPFPQWPGTSSFLGDL